MPSRYLYIPLVLAIGLLLYLGQNSANTYAITLLPILVVAGVVLYFFEPVVNWWWWKRFPPDLPEAVHPLLEKHCVFYQTLTDERKKIFRTRVFLFVQNKSWKPQTWETIPEDVKIMLATASVRLHFGQEKDYLLEHLENIVVAPSSFPSPQFPKDWHAAETYAPDGVLLFSAQHITRGFMESQRYLDISLYELARDYWQKKQSKINFPSTPASWQEIQGISGFQEDGLLKFIGLPNIDSDAILTCLFFTHPLPFAETNPGLFRQLREHFG